VIDDELAFLKAIGLSKRELQKNPDFMVKPSKDKVSIAICSKLEPLSTFGEYALITLSPQDFFRLSTSFQAIIKDIQS
jgi:hypothetical protein